MSQILLKIRSDYILKQIFSFMDYGHTLKLINKNKSLQNNLGINIINYKERSSYQYKITRKILKDFYKDDGEETSKAIKYFIVCLIYTIIAIILFIYILVFASLLVSKGSFNEKNTKNNYNKDYADIIKKINLSLFGFLPYIIIYYIFIFWATINCEKDYGKEKLIKKILLVLLGILCLCYEIIIVIKLILSYKIKNNKISWFIICDYILIIIIFLYLVFTIYIIISYFINSGNDVADELVNLTKFRDIKINGYLLPKYFVNFNDYQKRVMLLHDIDLFEIEISQKQKDIISLINQFRKDNNIDELIYDDVIEFKDLIFDKYSEPIFDNNKNIFKLSNRKYLIKIPNSEFETRFYNKEKSITNILLNDYLNKIIIIEKNDILFIFLFHVNLKRFLNKNIINFEVSERKRFPKTIYESGYNYEDIKYYEG